MARTFDCAFSSTAITWRWWKTSPASARITVGVIKTNCIDGMGEAHGNDHDVDLSAIRFHAGDEAAATDRFVVGVGRKDEDPVVAEESRPGNVVLGR